MTEKELAIGLLMFFLIFFLVVILPIGWMKPSDVHSRLPAPPEPERKAYGPLFIHIRFYYHVGIPYRPDLYLRADKITSLIGDYRNRILTIEDDGKKLKFEDVAQYSFVKQSQMSDYLFEEDIKKEIYKECYEPQD